MEKPFILYIGENTKISTNFEGPNSLMLGIQIKNIFSILHLGRLSPWLFVNLKIIIPSFWCLCLQTMVLMVTTLKLREVLESMWLLSFEHLDYNSLCKDFQMVIIAQ